MNNFESYCSRMWLDYCKKMLSTQRPISKDDYVERWFEWLLDKWNDRDMKEDSLYEKQEQERQQWTNRYEEDDER